MYVVFYISSAVAIAATAMVVTGARAVHALLYLVVSLLAAALVFYSLGAAFVAALEVIIYAGAIMVLFVFVVMMLNLGEESVRQERQWLRPAVWAGPAALALVLLVELVWVLAAGPGGPAAGQAAVGPKEVGAALYGPYVLGVELASMLLLAGIVGAYHLGRREALEHPQEEDP
jgi:NADH-quinone oxidoreductase subunit J